MPVLRRYIYDELLDVLELRYYLSYDSKSPALIILYGVHDGFITVRRRPSVTVTVVASEIHRLQSLTDSLHWKSFVKAHSITYEREVEFDNELFASDCDS